ncbi:Rpn family recombination-promoting nuclease/putative transposase [Clostridium sp. C8]|uniref:Rpn family recombination-promoting nuclease/putative transposase n=1 Tax=Clostridium sp. C8 TaxID=1667357 RepID=UPI000A7C98A5|nr:Rpn family recombination-promoting nuclease/putative transposase [Clostridium sp. C8]
MLEEKKYKGDGILDIIDQAHDKLFKETFGNSEIAKDFMNEYLPGDSKNHLFLFYNEFK